MARSGSASSATRCGGCSGAPPRCASARSTAPWRYFRLCTDHKVVGIQYLVAVLFFFFVAGFNAMMIRSELTSTNGTLINSGNYLTLVGLHGTMMLMMMSAGVLGPLGNYLVPLMIGARRMAFPRVEALTLWLTVLAGVVLLSAIALGGFPTGWTGYAPLADEARGGIDAYLFSFALIGISLALVGINIMTTVITMRAPGMTWNRDPDLRLGPGDRPPSWRCWPRRCCWRRSSCARWTGPRTPPSSGQSGRQPLPVGQPVLVLRPPRGLHPGAAGFGIVLEILPVFARKPLWGYRLAVAGMFGVALLGFMVWQHHLFVSGINANLRPFYMFTTELISIPTGLIFLNAMGALWRRDPLHGADAVRAGVLLQLPDRRRLRRVPVRRALDVTTHGSYFVIAHFHYTIMGGLVFALMAGLYYWVPKMTGFKLSEGLGKLHFWTMFIFFNTTFFPLFAAGLLGMPRRVSSYNPSLHTLNVFVSISAFCLGTSMVILLVNLVWSLVLKREIEVPNPWHALSLEWQLPSPPPVYNFEEIPVINSGPYDYGVPDRVPIADLRPTVTGGEVSA